MSFSIQTTGMNAVQAKLNAIASKQSQIERAAVGAGTAVIARAVKSASKGTIKRETGGYVRTVASHFVGVAGLLKFPRRGVRGRQPHGVFLDQGTRYITAQRFVSNAIKSATPRAQAAMKNAANRKFQQLSNSN